MSKRTKFNDFINIPKENVHVDESGNEQVAASVDGHTNKHEPVNTSESVDENTNKLVQEKEPEYVHVNVTRKSSAKQDWKQKPNSFEATHTRKTVWIRDDLLNLLNSISLYRGDITSNLNEALETFIKKKQKGKGEKE